MAASIVAAGEHVQVALPPGDVLASGDDGPAGAKLGWAAPLPRAAAAAMFVELTRRLLAQMLTARA
eukprot:361008-Chlamydomonas_euryale.AAC.1